MHSLIRFTLMTLLGVISLGDSTVQGAISLQGGVYHEDFNQALDLNHWSFSAQENNAAVATVGVRSYTDGGRSHVNSGSGDGFISGTGPADVTYPLPAFVTPRSFGEFGFSGSWLTNVGGLKTATGGDYANGNTSIARTATVSFEQLRTHEKIQEISFLLGVGDSIDANEGVFEVKLDGQVIYRQDFNNSIGGELGNSPPTGLPNFTQYATVETYAVGANLKSDGFYRETWTGTSNTNQRRAETWTLEGAHKITLRDLLHTSDTMNLTFSWYGLNGDFGDEFIAMDNLTIVVPEPGHAGLFAFGVLGLVLRRQRRN